MSFKDLFSGHANDYAKYRPNYPEALFRYLATLTKTHDQVWDCGTGNGQAARGLAPFFKKVIATDPSAKQLSEAIAVANVEYRVAQAETNGLPAGAFDLVTVAQALHWFKLDVFFAEVRRVLKPGGTLAVWCYPMCTVAPEIDAILMHYYNGVVGPYWEKERLLVDNHYRDIPFPFNEIKTPAFAITLSWTLPQMMGYLESWSATQTAKKKLGKDPREDIVDSFREAWGAPTKAYPVTWPVIVRAGTI